MNRLNQEISFTDYEDHRLIAECPQCGEKYYIRIPEQSTTCPQCGENLDLDLDYARSVARDYEDNHCANKAAAVYVRVLLSYPECEWAIEGMKRFESYRDLNIFDYLSMGILPFLLWELFPSLASIPALLALFAVSAIFIYWFKKYRPITDPYNPLEDPQYLLNKSRREYSEFIHKEEERRRIQYEIYRDENY